MSEFEPFDPQGIVKETEALRARKEKQFQVRRERNADEVAEEATAARSAGIESERRTAELFERLGPFNGFKTSDKNPLLVERPASRPGGKGQSVVGETPRWIIIRTASVGFSARHTPDPGGSTQEIVLAARCNSSPRYELLIYPIGDQHTPSLKTFDDTATFIHAIQDAIADR